MEFIQVLIGSSILPLPLFFHQLCFLSHLPVSSDSFRITSQEPMCELKPGCLIALPGFTWPGQKGTQCQPFLKRHSVPSLLTGSSWWLVSGSEEEVGFTSPEMFVHSTNRVTFMVSSRCHPQLTRQTFLQLCKPCAFLTPSLLMSRKYHSE